MDRRTTTLAPRNEINSAFKWKLEDIYSTNEDWEIDFSKVKQLMGKMPQYQSSISNSSSTLYNCLKLSEELTLIAGRLFVYAHMRRDEDNSDPVYQQLNDRATSLLSDTYAAISFISPKLIQIPRELINQFMREMPELKVYSQFFNELFRQKEHILSEKEELIVAKAMEIIHAPKDIFTMFNNADIRFPVIKDKNGNDVELTKGNYITFLQDPDREIRKNAFISLHYSYMKYENTIAKTLMSSLKSDIFVSGVRKYSSSIEDALDADNININVYDNLIDVINKNLPLLHRYLKLRKKALKLDDLHAYDLYVPIVPAPLENIDYSNAIDTVEQGLRVLGDEYTKNLRHAFNSGWIDVYENQGKTSGAYSWGIYGVHPYVLLNYQSTLNDVLTIAHEMGHALHSFYTNNTQPYTYSEYKIFVAEVASTVNETLLIRYMIQNAKTLEEKAYLLNHYLEEFRATVFRQTMFAEFEKLIHAEMESGRSLNAQGLKKLYLDLNSKYFGPEFILDDELSIEWGRIPHFYNGFYVYKYATGFSAATALSNQILSNEASAIEKYMNFLSSGSSDYPLQLLKNAGVDLSTSKPIQDALNVFEGILSQLEEIIK